MKAAHPFMALWAVTTCALHSTRIGTSRGKKREVVSLLRRQVPTRAEQANDCTPLITKAMLKLFHAGVDENWEDNTGWKRLMRASAESCAEVVRLLLGATMAGQL